MTSRVQTRKTPPVLQPLADPLSRAKPRLLARIKLIRDYAEKHRELDITEIKELFDLEHIVECGRLPEVGSFSLGKVKKVKPLTCEELLA